jgi:hypothetical protein
MNDDQRREVAQRQAEETAAARQAQRQAEADEARRQEQGRGGGTK